MSYRGRFAPSPTGPLHFGSLIAALGSFLDARARGGVWLVRMEDIDPPREQPGAARLILEALESFALTWDGEVLYQSMRRRAHLDALEALRVRGLCYPCACPRRLVAGRPYPGTCRNGMPPGRRAGSMRLRTDGARLRWTDLIQGEIARDIERDYGDFILHRADGLIAYHLAVTVDDIGQDISTIVRGADLLDATAPQIYLQRLLGAESPAYAHLPVAVDAHGRKLSKQNHAQPLDPARPVPALLQALRFLGQTPPAELADARAEEVVRWAIARWRLEDVPATREQPTPTPENSGLE
jgi:glutamyl-Q tRNA(Asp) synthetase